MLIADSSSILLAPRIFILRFGRAPRNGSRFIFSFPEFFECLSSDTNLLDVINFLENVWLTMSVGGIGCRVYTTVTVVLYICESIFGVFIVCSCI